MKNVNTGDNMNSPQYNFSRIFKERQEEIIDEYAKKLRDKTCFI